MITMYLILTGFLVILQSEVAIQHLGGEPGGCASEPDFPEDPGATACSASLTSPLCFLSSCYGVSFTDWQSYDTGHRGYSTCFQNL